MSVALQSTNIKIKIFSVSPRESRVYEHTHTHTNTGARVKSGKKDRNKEK